MVAENISELVASTSTDERLNCNFAEYSTKHDFRILNQQIKVCNFDAQEERFTVFTKCELIVMRKKVSEIHFSMGSFSYLPNEELGPSDIDITVQGYQAEYSRNILQLKETNQIDRKNLKHLKSSLKRAYDKFKGGLTVKIPKECSKDIKEHRVIVVCICTNVVRPKHGIKFDFKVDETGNQIVGGHAFTYRSGIFSSTHEWLPCFDATDQLALWIIELEVPDNFVAISCGELVKTSHDAERRLRSSIFHLKVPTTASNIGFVIGDLESYSFSDLTDVTAYSLPGLTQVLENTVSSVSAILTFLEETLAGRFPYSSYKLAFVDNVSDEVITFAGLSIFSINLLHHKRILDVVQANRQIMAHGIACQFFGCLVNVSEFADFWVVKAMARYVTGLYIERTFGLSEYTYMVNRLMEVICEYEEKFGAITLRHQNKSHADLHFDPTCPNSCSSNYAEMLYKKGQLVLRILETRLGKEQFLKVLQRIVLIALEYGGHLEKPVDWYHTVVSIDSFFNTVISVTGRELSSFVDLYINTGGHYQFDIQYVPNRKRNTIELEIRQEIQNKRGCSLYNGPLTISVQELDGYFSQTINVSSDYSKHDIPCHSKGRRQKKKKVIISTGEELEIDLSSLDADSSIMWIRIDPSMQLIRRISISQPSSQWEYMLRHERCVVAQLEAIENLIAFPNQQTQNALYHALQNDQFFYRVRKKAALNLTEICNRLPDGLINQTSSTVMDFFKNRYGCNSDPRIPALNNFVATSSNLQNYFLMLELPPAIALVRRDSQCPNEVVDFLLGLLKYNDNSSNRYSDDHYRAVLVNALSSTLSQTEHSIGHNHMDSSRSDVSDIILEVTRTLNKDITNPSYSRVVASACLKAILMLQRRNYLPLNLEIFWTFAQSQSVFSLLRWTAYACLCSLVSKTHNSSVIDNVDKLFETMLHDQNPYIRYSLGNQLISTPPFSHTKDIIECKSYPANSEQLAEKLWTVITDLKTEPRLRTMFVDIFYVMYSNETPFMFYSESERRRMEEEQRRNNELGTNLHKL